MARRDLRDLKGLGPLVASSLRSDATAQGPRPLIKSRRSLYIYRDCYGLSNGKSLVNDVITSAAHVQTRSSELADTAILREVAKAMILAHAQFVLHTPVDTFEFVHPVILEGGATAKETPAAETEPDAIAESGPRPTVSIFRKTNCACAKIIAVRNLQLHVKLQYTGFQVRCPN